MSERYFYHSFPRRGSKLGDPNGLGLRILDSVARNGLLLVPEVVTWKDPLQPTEEPLRAYQRRVCFTELAPSEVAGHSEVFGSFALEYSIDELRSLGALPVVYVPNGDQKEIGLESTGTAMLAYVAGAISLLKRAGSIARTPGDLINFTLNMRDGEETKGSFSPEETVGIRKFVALVEKAEGMTMPSAADALGAMSSLFYPTENTNFTGSLGYYRQREWRIVSGTRLGMQDVTLPATAEQQEQLLDTDKGFFERPIAFSDGESTLAKKSHFMPIVTGKHVLARARRVVVPSGQESESTRMLRQHGFDVPVVGAGALAS